MTSVDVIAVVKRIAGPPPEFGIYRGTLSLNEARERENLILFLTNVEAAPGHFKLAVVDGFESVDRKDEIRSHLK